MADKKDKTSNPIQVADKLFQAVELLASSGPVGLIELSEKMGIHKSSLHRVLNSLIYMGYARQNEHGKYMLTFKITRLSTQLLERVDVIPIIHPYLEKIMDYTGETVHLVEIDGTNAVYIDKVDSDANSVRMISRIGNKIPLYCSGVGKALLAAMDDHSIKKIWEQSEIIAHTPKTITTFDNLMKTIQKIRETGYSLDDEENELGVTCIAAAVEDYSGRANYAFSVSAPASRLTPGRIEELSGYIIEIKQELSAVLQ